MRWNVLGWLTDKVPKAQHALVLTHNIDFLFLQSVLAPLLRRAGDPRLVVFADAACAAQAFSAQSSLLEGLGDRYRVVPVDLGGARRFHPKALLLSGSGGAALAVGSGNLTHGGMSANHEAWAFATSDGEGASMIAALRDYMATLLPRLPLSEPLGDWLATVFDEAQLWAAGLPQAAGLAGSPAAIPLLEQVAAAVAETVHAVEVLAPYHDEHGAALAAIAAKFAAPVTCWMQPGRAGLSRTAAAGLPGGVTLRSIDCEPERRPSFIHAKVLAFRGDVRTVLAVGSANCSQAALLADASWGNAELMAIGAVSHEEAEALFSPGSCVATCRRRCPSGRRPRDGLYGRRAPPNSRRSFRGRPASGRLSRPAGIADVVGVLAGWAQPPASMDDIRSVATFDVPLRPRTVALRAVGPDGASLASAEAWVDEESSLCAPATLRRMIQRLREEGDAAALPAKAFRDVLELFRDYVFDPEAARRRVDRAKSVGQATGSYDPLAVFSEAFGGGQASSDGRHGRTGVIGLLSIVEALFAVDQAPVEAAPTADRDGAEIADGDEPDAEAEQRRLLGLGRPAPEPREAAQLRRALSAVEQALRAPAFVEGRTPALLGADLALAAILLSKGLASGLLDVAAFRNTTRSLWGSLLFGEGDAPGTLTARIASIAAGEEREAYLVALCSPRLSAALALWCSTEWAAEDADALWFRLSAAMVHQDHPYLFGAAAAETVLAEIGALAAVARRSG